MNISVHRSPARSVLREHHPGGALAGQNEHAEGAARGGRCAVRVRFPAVKGSRAGLLVFSTSAVVLVLEVLAGRLMAPYVGVSQETFTGVIGTVLAGIALGASIGGRLADRQDPNVLLGPVLVIGGSLIWASLPILRLLGPLVGSGPFAIVVLTTAAFLAPAMVLSAVSPMVAKMLLESLDDSGSIVGRVSAMGTIGALVGTFLTGFVLVTALPTQWVVLLIGGLTIVGGIVLTVRHHASLPGGRAAVVILLVPGLGAVTLPPPCDRESAYFCINVERDESRPTGRSLILDRTRHAYVDLDDPTHLELRYVRLIADVVEAASPDAAAVDALHLGGGGFTLPRYLSATRPGSTHVVLEIDPTLVEVARDELGLAEDAADIVVGDARLALAELPTDGFDLIVGDAFASTSVPWHLTTVETMRQLRRVLRPGGIYVMNVIDGGANRYARAQLATLVESFDHVAAIMPPGGVGDLRQNQILVASDAPIADLTVDPDDGVFVAESRVAGIIGGAEPLTDDFAPVDQMLMR